MPAPRRRTLILVSIWLLAGLLVHLAAPTWNGIKLAGIPLGYWLAAQGGPLILAALMMWVAPGTTHTERGN